PAAPVGVQLASDGEDIGHQLDQPATYRCRVAVGVDDPGRGRSVVRAQEDGSTSARIAAHVDGIAGQCDVARAGDPERGRAAAAPAATAREAQRGVDDEIAPQRLDVDEASPAPAGPAPRPLEIYEPPPPPAGPAGEIDRRVHRHRPAGGEAVELAAVPAALTV